MSAYLGAALKRRLYPTVCCYHGCVARRADALTFRESLADVRAHVRTLQQQGYTFVGPEVYAQWQAGLITLNGPVACIHFDDGLESIELVVPWLIEQGIPCGLALIARRQRLVDPEADFLSWARIYEWTRTGFVEVMSHTYNLHHMTVIGTDAGVDVAPIMEGPWWIDPGDVVHVLDGDDRWYWDFSLIDSIALAIPVWGTDQYDGTTPIETTITLTPKASGSVQTLRFWMALSKPLDATSVDGKVVSAGYDANVVISVRGAPALAVDPPAVITPGLGSWFSTMTRGHRKVAFIGDSTTAVAGALYNAFNAAIAALLPETEVINRGNDGKTAADWIAGSVPNPPATCYADAADLYIVSFGLNDVRNGACDEPTLKSRLTTIVNMLRTNVPGCSVILRMPNSMLSTDPTSTGWVNPLSSAQTYTNIMRGAYLDLIGTWADVAVWDAMDEVFGTTCPATSALMADILHPSIAGYTAIGDALAALIVPDGWTESGGTSWATVWDGIVRPKQYPTRSQWVAREYYSINLDTPFAITAGTKIDLKFATQNAGFGLAMLYARPAEDPEAFHAVSTCRSLLPDGTQTYPWQYIDYPAGERYPLVPCMILVTGTGASATEAQYAAAMDADADKFNAALGRYPHKRWNPVTIYQVDDFVNPGKLCIGWHNPARSVTVIPIKMVITEAVWGLQIYVSATENFQGGDGDVRTYDDRPTTVTPAPWIQAAIDEALSRNFTACFSVSFSDDEAGPWQHVCDLSIYEMQRKKVVELNTTFTMTAMTTHYLRIELLNDGWHSGTMQRVRWQVMQIDAICEGTAKGPALTATQIVYPFGSYLTASDGPGEARPGFQDVGTALKTVFTDHGYTHGYTIQGVRNVRTGEFREPDLRQTEWALGRWLVYGDQAGDVSRNNLAALSGFAFQDVPARGVEWQASLEPDPQGNASVRARADTLDYVAFDAWFFDGAGGITESALNDGGIYDGETYADDKGWLQARGVRCTLILSNYNATIDDVDPDIGSHVVNNPATYIPLIVAVAVDDGWDGITMNLEAVPAADRAAATDFYTQLARALHAAGKLLHATTPAPTGTDYDADWWVGWCDHGALAKVCDAIKIMSYTESGPGTDPGPAAPQWFWDAVYARIRAIVPEPYWPRVLCGCRAFGHEWDAATPAEADYITYHKAIADALNYGKRIDVRDTEMGWGTGTITAWCGTPMTVDRAQLEALGDGRQNGFGGIGLWKLDDGDIEEFIPPVRQIGRDEDMSFLDGVTFPESVSRGSSGGPEFSTSVVESQSGDEARNGRRMLPLGRYDAAVGVRTQEMADAVRDVFMVARGKLNTFRFKDWQDYRLTDGVIGTADGIITNFQLVKVYEVGAHALTRPIILPRSGTLTVKRNGSPIAGWTCNYNTGLVSFASPPAAGVISATCEFDVLARFDVDYLPTEIVARNITTLLFQPGSIPLVERRA